MKRTLKRRRSLARGPTLRTRLRDTKCDFERFERHISGPQAWKVLGVEGDADEIVADPNPDDPVEEVASNVGEGSFVKVQRLSGVC